MSTQAFAGSHHNVDTCENDKQPDRIEVSTECSDDAGDEHRANAAADEHAMHRARMRKHESHQVHHDADANCPTSERFKWL